MDLCHVNQEGGNLSIRSPPGNNIRPSNFSAERTGAKNAAIVIATAIEVPSIPESVDTLCFGVGEDRASLSSNLTKRQTIDAMSAAELQDAKNDVLARFKAMLKEEDKTPWGAKTDPIDQTGSASCVSSTVFEIIDSCILLGQGTDSTLRRFLKAREFNLEDAYKMYTSCLRWRKENNIDKVLDKEPEKVVTGCFPLKHIR
eukprot:1321526-Amorphochlora_amoeboformis.AAC.1